MNLERLHQSGAKLETLLGGAVCKIKIRNLFLGSNSLSNRDRTQVHLTHNTAAPASDAVAHAGSRMPLTLDEATVVRPLWTHCLGTGQPGAHRSCILLPMRTALPSEDDRLCILVLWSFVVLHTSRTSMAWSQGHQLGQGKPKPIGRGHVFMVSFFNFLKLVTIRN